MAGSETRKREKTTTIRFSADELDTVKSRAREAGLSTGSWLRQVAINAPPPRQARRPVVDRELLAVALARMGKIGSNINQLAKKANTGVTPDIAELRAACDAVRDIRTIIYLALGYDVDMTDPEQDSPP